MCEPSGDAAAAAGEYAIGGNLKVIFPLVALRMVRMPSRAVKELDGRARLAAASSDSSSAASCMFQTRVVSLEADARVLSVRLKSTIQVVLRCPRRTTT